MTDAELDALTELVRTVHLSPHERTQAADAIAALRSERDAIRELMNVYNLGGWTDAIAPMNRALAAEADNAALRQDAERYRFIASNDWGVAYNEQIFDCLLKCKDPTELIDAALLAGKESIK